MNNKTFRRIISCPETSDLNDTANVNIADTTEELLEKFWEDKDYKSLDYTSIHKKLCDKQ
jgi:hypothetical protein